MSNRLRSTPNLGLPEEVLSFLVWVDDHPQVIEKEGRKQVCHRPAYLQDFPGFDLDRLEMILRVADAKKLIEVATGYPLSVGDKTLVKPATSWRSPSRNPGTDWHWTLRHVREFMKRRIDLPAEDRLRDSVESVPVRVRLTEAGRAKVAEYRLSVCDSDGTGAGPRKRGRPPRSPSEIRDDEKIVEAWESGSFRTYEELGRERGLSGHDVRSAVERERKRCSRRGD